MKRIGIMSMQRVVNYGSFLQAYGLKTIIESLGYKAEFIDYHYEEPLNSTRAVSFSIKTLLKKIIHPVDTIKRKVYNDKLKTSYKKDISSILGISEEKKYVHEEIDELVIGSDEVFNCLQGYPVGYSKELFGKNCNVPVISYAACFGNTTLADLKKHRIDVEIGSMLKKFKAISVRDNNSFNVVKLLTSKSASLNLDPVLVFDFPEHKKNIKFRNYIILYAYASRLSDEEKKTIRSFAKKHDKKILSIGSYQEIADHNLVMNPLEIFSYFKNADFIITDTFHGSIFSIKTQSNFCTIVRTGKTGNNNKLYDLLDRLKQTSRIINDISDIEKLYGIMPDYTETNIIVEIEKNNTLKYLRKNLA